LVTATLVPMAILACTECGAWTLIFANYRGEGGVMVSAWLTWFAAGFDQFYAGIGAQLPKAL